MHSQHVLLQSPANQAKTVILRRNAQRLITESPAFANGNEYLQGSFKTLATLFTIEWFCIHMLDAVLFQTLLRQAFITARLFRTGINLEFGKI